MVGDLADFGVVPTLGVLPDSLGSRLGVAELGALGVAQSDAVRVANGDQGFAAVGGAERTPEGLAAAVILRVDFGFDVDGGGTRSGGGLIARSGASDGLNGRGYTRSGLGAGAWAMRGAGWSG